MLQGIERVHAEEALSVARMMDMNCIIFSKNRAMQLAALLESIQRNAPQWQDYMVIWNCTDYDFRMAYWDLQKEYPPFRFCLQSNFREQVLALARSPREYISFLVDDDMFYRPVPEFTVDPGGIFAPRLGRNCTYCYMGDRSQVVPPELWRDATDLPGNDFDCTFSLDGHVYHTEDVLPQLKQVDFGTPNQLEAALSSVIRYRMHWHEHSSLVGIPHNSVGELKTNRFGNGSAEELNRMFLDGWRIDLSEMDFSDVHGCHQEIGLRFKRSE